MVVRGMLCLLLGCATATQGSPTARTSSEVRAFEEDLRGCHEDGEEAADACQEALLVAATCDNGGRGAVCDHLRAEGSLPPEPPPMRTLLGCWEIIEVDGAVARASLVEPADPPPTHLCLEAHGVLFGYGGIWNRWRIAARGWERQDSRAHAGYATHTAIGELQLLVDGDELALRVPGTLVRTRLRRSDVTPPAVPTFDEVCGAARRCLEARAAAALPPEAEGPGDSSAMVHPWRLSECHCQLLAAAREEAAWGYANQWNEHAEPRRPIPDCAVESLPYDDSMLPVCALP